MKKMYGLFMFTYDYYEFESILCVSESTDSLNAEYIRSYGPNRIINEEQHDSYRDSGESHYVIMELEVV